MKKLFLITAVTMLFGSAVPAAKAALHVSVDFFHDNLESYGDWREVGDYGYCWQPRDVDPDWRPYSDGRWLYTDAGWTWDSDEPYAWAVYHYGRWARLDRVGWVWVPGTEWGPAWVSWRRSPRHVGWAPLPPDAQFSRSVGFNARVDADYDIGPSNYSFVEVRNFGAPRLRTVIIQPRENITIIQQTTNITRITYVNNVVYNEGPRYEVISRESAQPIRRLKLDRRDDFEGESNTVRAEQLKTRVEGDSLRVMALPFDSSKPATTPRKVAARVEKAEVDRGWKDAGPEAEVAKLRTKIKNEPATPTEPTAEAKTEKTAEAPVASSGPDEKSTKAEKRAKGVREEAPIASPTAEEAVQAPTESKKSKKKADKPAVVKAAPNPEDRKSSTENAEPAPVPAPEVVQKPRKEKKAAREAAKSKPEPAVAPEAEPKASQVPKPGREAPPAAAQPQAQPTNGNGKVKGKNKEKKQKNDAAAPEATPQ